MNDKDVAQIVNAFSLTKGAVWIRHQMLKEGDAGPVGAEGNPGGGGGAYPDSHRDRNGGPTDSGQAECRGRGKK